MTRRLLLPMSIVVLIAVGVAAGLFYGWLVDPVEYQDVDPADLSRRHKRDYLQMIAASYLVTEDLEAARRELTSLGYGPDDVAAEARDAIAERRRLAPALASLSVALGEDAPEIAAGLPTPTPTVTPTPTATPTPSPTPTATSTPVATDTPLPTETPTATAIPATATRPPAPTSPPATATPAPPTATPTPSIDFVVTKTRMLTKEENPGADGCGMNVLFLRAIDAAGNPLDGIQLQVRWETGSEVVTTGTKGPGTVEFALAGAYHVKVIGDVNGRTYTSQETREIDSRYPDYADLIQAGYCSNEAECREREENNQLCYGHYSWDAEFQRTW